MGVTAENLAHQADLLVRCYSNALVQRKAPTYQSNWWKDPAKIQLPTIARGEPSRELLVSNTGRQPAASQHARPTVDWLV
jgi:hypothetical protein